MFIDSDSQVMPDAVGASWTTSPIPASERSAVTPTSPMPGTTADPDAGNAVLHRLPDLQVRRGTVRLGHVLFGLFLGLSARCCGPRDQSLAPSDVPWSASTFGDDRSLTNFVLQNWRVLYAPDAQANTNVPEHLPQFLRQQLRWKKSWLRETPGPHERCAQAPDDGHDAQPVDPLAAAGSSGGAAGDADPAAFHRSELPFWYFGGVAVIALIYGMFYRMNKPVKRWYHGIFFTLFYTIVLVVQMPYAMATIRDSKWGTR